jgi:methionine transaminase
MKLPSIQSKLPATGTNIFTVMSALAAEHKAVNLGQGFPNYPMPAALVDLVAKAMRDGHNQYAPMAGWPPLLERIAEKSKFLYGADLNPATQITITPGGTYAIYTALTAILQPGDEVIVFEPGYDSYIPNIVVNGAVPVWIPLSYPGFGIDWALVGQKVTDRTRAIIINTPHNPTATILKESDIEQLRSIVADSNIVIISDEVYEHLIYDDAEHLSMLRYPDLMQRSFVCCSFGKVFHCTGWKLGYCISNAGFMQEFRKVHQYNCFSCFTPAQVAIAQFLEHRDSYLLLSSEMQKRRDYFVELMKQTRFDLLPAQGSYFVCATYNRISDEGDMALAKRMTIEHGVTPVPLSAFYLDGTDHHVLRFCFAKTNETLERAVERLAKI